VATKFECNHLPLHGVNRSTLQEIEEADNEAHRVNASKPLDATVTIAAYPPPNRLSAVACPF
jgi:hypothetical protein